MNGSTKAFLIVLLVFLGLSCASATVSVISPVVKTLSNNESFELGSVQPGETLELFFNKRTGSGGSFSNVRVDASTVPAGWIVSQPELLPESIGLKVSIPSDETERVQNLRFVFSTNENVMESVELGLNVRYDLIQFQLVPVDNDVSLGENAVFSFRAVNQSLAKHSFAVFSTLPDSSFEKQSFSLTGALGDLPNIDTNLVVSPKVYGKRDFSFRVVSMQNEKTLDQFNEVMTVHPTLEGKFNSGLFGLPVLAPNLNVFYFFNALASLFQ